MSDFDKRLEEALKDPAFKRVWDEDQPWYESLSRFIQFRIESGDLDAPEVLVASHCGVRLYAVLDYETDIVAYRLETKERDEVYESIEYAAARYREAEREAYYEELEYRAKEAEDEMLLVSFAEVMKHAGLDEDSLKGAEEVELE